MITRPFLSYVLGIFWTPYARDNPLAPSISNAKCFFSTKIIFIKVEFFYRRKKLIFMKTGSRESNQKCPNSIRDFLKISKSNAKRQKSSKKELNTSCMEPTRFCAWSTTFVIFLFIFLCQVSRECFWLTVTTVDRRGGAKADRKKEIAIATSIENFFYAHISRAAAPKFKMSPAHLVAFIDFVFPSFFKIIVNVFRNESLFSANNSVFHPSSRIPFC